MTWNDKSIVNEPSGTWGGPWTEKKLEAFCSDLVVQMLRDDFKKYQKVPILKIADKLSAEISPIEIEKFIHKNENERSWQDFRKVYFELVTYSTFAKHKEQLSKEGSLKKEMFIEGLEISKRRMDEFLDLYMNKYAAIPVLVLERLKKQIMNNELTVGQIQSIMDATNLKVV